MKFPSGLLLLILFISSVQDGIAQHSPPADSFPTLHLPGCEGPDPDPAEYLDVQQEPQVLNWSEFTSSLLIPPTAGCQMQPTGTVIVRILVGANGEHYSYVIVKDPHPVLTEKVKAQLPLLQFTPAIQNSRPVKCWLLLPVRFTED